MKRGRRSVQAQYTRVVPKPKGDDYPKIPVLGVCGISDRANAECKIAKEQHAPE
jgi:hypothetical protein